MTREEKIKVFEMRLDGYTLQRIANDMGVTRQRIYQILYERPRRGFKSIYPLLNGWMNAVSYTHLDVYKRQTWECPTSALSSPSGSFWAMLINVCRIS